MLVGRCLASDYAKGREIAKNRWSDRCNTDEIWEKLREYGEILYLWSVKMSLISKLDRERLYTRHVLPAMSWWPVIEAMPHSKILDVGSGAGLPGIPLKILFPYSEFILLDGRRKRANFLREVIRRLNLKKIEVVNSRLEDWKCDSGVDVVVSRAVSNPAVMRSRVRGYLRMAGLGLVNLNTHGRGKNDLLLEWERQAGSLGTRLGIYRVC